MQFPDETNTPQPLGYSSNLFLVEHLRIRNMISAFPQTLIDVDVKSKPDLQSISQIVDAIASVEKTLGEEGRVLEIADIIKDKIGYRSDEFIKRSI